ncbi:MAG: arginine--tRNA ligase, partial [Parcubacteria group bacterium]|nr:arginine--tRNA ligase [Parcubacteria group bacterium]
MLRNEIQAIIKEVTGKDAKVEHPIEAVFGDYSTNVAMKENLNPNEVAEKLKQNPLFEKVEVKGGFINFFVSKEYLQKQVKDVLTQKDKFGDLDIGKEKIQVEFISANPTGPLTLGNGRGGFCGDVLANVLAKVGYEVEREYYINDRGGQITKLGHSVIGDDEAVYKGEYIAELAKKIKGKDAEKVGEKSAQYILEKMIKPTVKQMGIKYDNWFSEKDLYKKKQVEKALDELKKQELSYKKEDALWFSSTKFGDDKD